MAAKPVRIPDGWPEHDGGKRPATVAQGSRVMRRDGTVGRFGWWFWDSRAPTHNDVIAYEPTGD